MDIVLIGSGNTATVVGRRSVAAGHRIVQVYSPDGAHANLLATRLATYSTSYISSIEKKADLMIIALRDEAVAGFAKNFGQTKSIVVHTAGAVPMSEISGISERFGVLYPLQSLRKEIEIMPALSILIDGNRAETRAILRKYAETIGETVLDADDEARLKYHFAATMVNNFTNHLYALMASYCEKEKISFAALQPIMEETVLRLRNTAPADVQTGAAFRNDLQTIEKHRQLIQDNSSLLRMYNLFTEEIQRFYGFFSE